MMVDVGAYYQVIYKHFTNKERNYDFEFTVHLSIIVGPLKMLTGDIQVTTSTFIIDTSGAMQKKGLNSGISSIS